MFNNFSNNNPSSGGALPPLPDPIATPGADDSQPTDDLPRLIERIPRETAISPEILQPIYFKALRHGCYLIRYTPTNGYFYHYDGTLRVERDGFNTIASGDLYYHSKLPYYRPIVTRAFASSYFFPTKPEPNPANGIPIFARKDYRYYVRVTQILEWLTLGSGFTLGYELHKFNHTTHTWAYEGTYSAVMSWTAAPSGYPDSGQYLTGTVKNGFGFAIGTLTMGWVSPYLRRATIEIDRYSQSELPLNNGSGQDWQDTFDQVDWQIDVDISDSNLVEPSGEFWSDAELHAMMVLKRDASNHDKEWRYHLLCVRRLDSTSRGIMYDAGGTDSNNLPREGAAISSHWVIPNTSQWGTVQGVRFGAATAPYFRTAVHELGHAMGLRHNTADNGFMNTTGVIASNPGTFPSNIQWTFNAADAKKLRHMPDAWVRPGEIAWAPSYSAPISPNDMLMDTEGLVLNVTPLLPSVPIGAPVRVHLELVNHSDETMIVPHSLSLKTEHVTGTVTGPSGAERTFASIIRCIEDEEHVELEPGESIEHDLTLLRGGQGALFPAPGLHEITVDVTWELSGWRFQVSGSAHVMISDAQNEHHAAAALRVLTTPDALLVLAMGGDHLEEGVEAIQIAVEDDVLRPHYAVIEAKRLAERFAERPPLYDRAMELITDETVMSGAEVRRVSEIVERADRANTGEAERPVVVEVLRNKAKKVVVPRGVAKRLENF